MIPLLNRFLPFILYHFILDWNFNIGFPYKLKDMKVKIKFLRKSLIIVRDWLNFSLRFRYLWREVRLLYFLSVLSLVEYNLRLSWIKPFASVFVSIPYINTDPILVVIYEMPSTPNQTLYMDVTIVYILNIFSHCSILITVSNFFYYPSWRSIIW